jgi:uncharacterized protein (DUF305 family)
MRQYIFIICFGLTLMACNANSDSQAQRDSSDHGAHNMAGNTEAGQNHMKQMHDSMNEMMQQMQSMKPTGDPDYDFAMMMKHHHQGAIDMAKAEVAGGTDEQLKQMARQMIEEQQRENDVFDRYMQGKNPSGNSDYGQRAMGMMTPMNQIKMESRNLDAMFSSMMIPHHQDAFEMAKEYLKVGKDAELRKVAQNIIETQPKEVEQFKQWLNAHKN